MEKKILILGVTGMLGSAVFKMLFNSKQFQVWGTIRTTKNICKFTNQMHECLIRGIDVLDHDSLVTVFERVRPDIVINCVGLIKQSAVAKDPLVVLPINAMFPHRLYKLCSLIDTRLIHISTDCVFNGQKGMYVENDVSDANDLYGKSKYIGELHNFPNALTLRTSIIGHELNSSASLVDWFLSQSDTVKGYNKAIFSGLPTVELARVIMDFIIPNIGLTGLYHVSVEPIDKYTLLNLIADIYGKEIEIIPDEKVRIDRSLDSNKFRRATGYIPPSWRKLVKNMHKTK